MIKLTGLALKVYHCAFKNKYLESIIFLKWEETPFRSISLQGTVSLLSFSPLPPTSSSSSSSSSFSLPLSLPSHCFWEGKGSVNLKTQKASHLPLLSWMENTRLVGACSEVCIAGKGVISRLHSMSHQEKKQDQDPEKDSESQANCSLLCLSSCGLDIQCRKGGASNSNHQHGIHLKTGKCPETRKSVLQI